MTTYKFIFFHTLTSDTLCFLSSWAMFWHNEQWNWKLKIFALHWDHAKTSTKTFGSWQQEQNSFYLLATFHFHGHESILLPSHIFNFIYFSYHHELFVTRSWVSAKKIRWVAPTCMHKKHHETAIKINFREILELALSRHYVTH